MNPTYLLLYVEDPLASGELYARLLDRRPVESSPGFVLFVLQSGVKLGLWRRSDVRPAAAGSPGAVEVCFTEPSADAVRARHAAWTAQRIPIAQAPTEMDFGTTFVGLDPDGHRLRVFAPPA